ncbi:MAG: NAD(+) synthase [Lachnospirales bacterium]
MFNSKKVKDEIVQWTKKYFEENATLETKAVVGISGGKDSSVVAALCVEALGKERVYGVLMPQGEQGDIDVSLDLCKALGIDYVVLNIKEPIDLLYEEFNSKDLKLNDVATFNTPARIRMTTIYAVSAMVGGRVANTCNLSEDWVGYATKFGDGAGDFSLLSSLTVTEVKSVGKELGLSDKFTEKVPIDGLCGKTDEENLGFTYEVLDKYIREGVCNNMEVKEKIDYLNKINLHKVRPMAMYKMLG